VVTIPLPTAETFDPRLMWDAAGQQTRSAATWA
jgi:uncharacterized paraquat-inducible protein A